MTNGHPRSAAFLCAAVFATSAIAGCGYPEFGPRAYEIARGLHTICDLKAENQLETVQGTIESDLNEGSITKREAAWLNSIVETAEAGDWQAAMAESRRMLDAQNEL
ncbi:hypothetical protein [Stratiformator vulcanicus]|uniref:Lipoprotein n=1 Tax=Stratiformator vulcanicus TaxID=2527980 RepID=A0A517QWJ2_9PLAN|nr:hypothetical protein [Stratiformator vulcanicus]QDT35940.1 hypothetical protein Pan189_02930 [Stratiformator vulcanicus]